MKEKIISYLVQPLIAGVVVALSVFGINFVLGTLFNIAPFIIIPAASLQMIIGGIVFLWVDGVLLYVLWHERVMETLLKDMLS